MESDSGIKLRELRTDGGMVVNDLLMQLQADALDVPVVRPKMRETTALGAPTPPASPAASTKTPTTSPPTGPSTRTWTPQTDPTTRARHYRRWKKAITRSFAWEDDSAD